MTGEALAEALDSDRDGGLFAVVASIGTTNAGLVDDISGIAKTCRERGLWMHIDGAYGGAALVAPSVSRASVELVITETEPGLQGDRVSGARKPATLETGLVVQVPLFIELGERVKVDTRSGDYLSRA